jgi:HEAT repeat protein
MVIALQSGAEAEIKSEAIRTLWRVPSLSRETVAAVRAALSDTSPQVRAYAARLLGHRHDVESIPDITCLLQDVDPHVREAGVKVLGALMQDSPWESVGSKALSDEDAGVVTAALSGLKRRGLLTRAHLEPLFQHADLAVRREALGAINVEEGDLASIIPTLVEMLEQEQDIDLIESLVASLGRCGDARVLPFLHKMVAHCDEGIRLSAIHSLGALGDEQTRARLISLLDARTVPVTVGDDGISHVAISPAIREEARGALAWIRARDSDRPQRASWKFW